MNSWSAVSVLTPPGRSALATIGLRGPLAWPAVRELFTPRGNPLPEEPEPGRFWLGSVGEDLADEAVLAARETGLELHVHGGREVVRYLVELFVARGMRLRTWDAYLNSHMEWMLAECRTTRTASILLDQCHGALRRELERAEDALGRGDVAACRAVIEALARDPRPPLGSPARVVIAGAPNVGKSSLINALAGYQRSVVSPTPGTTRDVTVTETAIDGWPVELVDTAGLRAAADDLEAAGVGQAREAAEQATLCLWLLDASADPVWPDVQAKALQLVVNKCDLEPAWDLSAAGGAPRVSASTGEGVPELQEAISRWLVPFPPEPGAGVILSFDDLIVVTKVMEELAAGQVEEARGLLHNFIEDLATSWPWP